MTHSDSVTRNSRIIYQREFDLSILLTSVTSVSPQVLSSRRRDWTERDKNIFLRETSQRPLCSDNK